MQETDFDCDGCIYMKYNSSNDNAVWCKHPNHKMPVIVMRRGSCEKRETTKEGE